MDKKNKNPEIGPNRNDDGSVMFRSKIWNPKLPSKDARTTRRRGKDQLKKFLDYDKNRNVQDE